MSLPSPTVSICTVDDVYDPLELGDRLYSGYQPGEYLIPIDGREQERQDFQHAIYRLILEERLSVLQFQSPAKLVLDIGTGTGIWAIEYAKHHPQSVVIGTDLARIQPTSPVQNCSWKIGNSENEDWYFCEQPFDFIHLRSMGPCFDNFPAMIQRCFDNLNPGGWIELQDGCWELNCIDDTAETSSLPRFFQLVCQGAAKFGRDMLKAKTFKACLEQAGFVNVSEMVFPVAGGPWPKDPRQKLLGEYARCTIDMAVYSMDAFLRCSDLAPEEHDIFLSQVREDLRRDDIHWWLPTYFVVGQKP